MEATFEYDVFISFASNDEEIAKPVWQDLSLNGLRVFWSDQNLKNSLGDSWSEVIQSSLEKSRHFLLICTKNSMSSEWVRREYEAFYNHCYKPGTRRLVPILDEDYKLTDLPLFLRGLQACRLDNRETVRELIRVLGGTNIEQLRIALSTKEKEIGELLSTVEMLRLKLKEIQDEKNQLEHQLFEGKNAKKRFALKLDKGSDQQKINTDQLASVQSAVAQALEEFRGYFLRKQEDGVAEFIAPNCSLFIPSNPYPIDGFIEIKKYFRKFMEEPSFTISEHNKQINILSKSVALVTYTVTKGEVQFGKRSEGTGKITQIWLLDSRSQWKLIHEHITYDPIR